jgi:hypothetical protein
MPIETQEAINLALQQEVIYEEFGVTVKVTEDTPTKLVGKIREYFNANNISYESFSYDDLHRILTN